MNTIKYTYFIQSENGGNIKIGRTSQDPLKRLANLQTGSPTKLRIVGLIKGDKEEELHKRFDQYRVHGEWFSASDCLLDYIEEQCSKDLSILLITNKEKLNGRVVEPKNVTRKLSIPISSDDDLDFKHYFTYSNEDDIDLIIDSLETHDYWDCIDYTNDDELCDKERSERLEEAICEYDVIEHMSYFMYCNNDFFKGVGLNHDNDLFCVVCEPCSSSRRLNLLRQLSHLVGDWDFFPSNYGWRFVALFNDGDKKVGIDLMSLYRDSMGWRDSYVFDPSVLKNNYVGCIYE
jgi:hypothetical protein